MENHFGITQSTVEIFSQIVMVTMMTMLATMMIITMVMMMMVRMSCNGEPLWEFLTDMHKPSSAPRNCFLIIKWKPDDVVDDCDDDESDGNGLQWRTNFGVS